MSDLARSWRGTQQECECRKGATVTRQLIQGVAFRTALRQRRDRALEHDCSPVEARRHGGRKTRVLSCFHLRCLIRRGTILVPNKSFSVSKNRKI